MTDAVDELGEVDFPETVSAGAAQRLYELRMFEETADLAEKTLQSCLGRLDGLSATNIRDLLRLEDGRFVMRFDGTTTITFARWVADDVFLTKKVWTEDYYDIHDAGDVEYALSGSDSVGHRLSHLVGSHPEKTVLLRENHFNEALPEREALDEVKGNIDVDEIYAAEVRGESA